MMEQNYPKVAVVILSWNGLSFLEEFIPPLLLTTYPNVELIVADNASTDGSVAFLQNTHPRVRVIETGGNWGFAQGYNVALQQVEADYYVLLNQDVAVTPGWIEPVIAQMEQDPTIGAAQPKIRAYHNQANFEYAGAAGGYMDHWGFMFCRGRIFDTIEPDNGQYDTVQDIFWASGAALFIKAKLWHGLGGLDADFFAHMEEIDLCWRLKNAGYNIVYCPQSTVYHVGGGSLPQGNPRKTFLNFRNNLSILVKNLPASQLITTIVPRMFMDDAAALRSLLGGAPADTWAIVKSHFAFYAQLPALLRKRKIIQQRIKAVAIGKPNQRGLYQGSIIYQHFVKGKKFFSQLSADKFL